MITRCAAAGLSPSTCLARRGASRPIFKWLKEKNAAFRETSEAAHDKSLNKLNTDWKEHGTGVNAIRNIIRYSDDIRQAAPRALHSTEEAFVFPEMKAVRLNGVDVTLSAGDMFGNRLTLLGCSGSRFGQPMVDAWLSGADERDTPEAAPTLPLQVLRLSLLESTFLSWMKTPLLASMRSGVPQEHRDAFLCCFGSVHTARQKMRMTNQYLGYVCLVDGGGVVRWHVHSSDVPTADEIG